MKSAISLFLLLSAVAGFAQDDYDNARKYFDDNKLDFARYYVNQALKKNPTTDEYFLSAMIYEAEGKDLRAVADYEAVVQTDPNNLEAYFQKGMIYYNSGSLDKAIEDFSYVIDNYDGSQTQAVYYANDPHGEQQTFITTLQSMLGQVYQHRGLSYKKKDDLESALADFTKAFEFDKNANFYINRAQVYTDLGKKNFAIKDLNDAIKLDPDNNVAIYNLALIDEESKLPEEKVRDEEFAPMMNLLGVRSFEKEEYNKAASYFTGAIQNAPEDPLAYINRGKVFIRQKKFDLARKDFLDAIKLVPKSTEAYYLVGNTFYYEKSFEKAIGFYEQYLEADRSVPNVWYNNAMAHLSIDRNDRACQCLEEAAKLGMQAAIQAKDQFCKPK